MLFCLILFNELIWKKSNELIWKKGPDFCDLCAIYDAISGKDGHWLQLSIFKIIFSSRDNKKTLFLIYIHEKGSKGSSI